MSTLHLERLYAYGDNTHYHIDVPDGFKMYEIPYIAENQKRYIWFGVYNKQLEKAFEKCLAVHTYHIENMLLIVAFNNPLGNIIHTNEHVETDLTEFNRMFEYWIKQFVIVKYIKNKMVYDDNPIRLFNRLSESDITEDERQSIIEELEAYAKMLNDKNICSISRVLHVNGDKLNTVTISLCDVLLRPFNAITVSDEDIDKVFIDIEFDDKPIHDIYAKLERDLPLFYTIYKDFRKQIEV